ncbi:MAG: hypothetical protein JSU93_07280 [Methanobacteriota archaeon]|nr:MAG: hypothetical protein JSU93_07280 [Euryarchaeota archaeon]
MADIVLIVSGVAGFAPAMALMFYTLRDYTFPAVEKPFFDDRKVFAFFALGIVLGMVLFAFEEWGSTASSAETLLVLIIGFALMEESMKLMILNFPRFQRKIDTAFYGLSFGLGISATFTFATIYASALGIEEPSAIDMTAYALLGFQFVLLHGATTAFIGIGVARGEVKPYFSEALLIHIGYNLFMVPFFMYDVIEPPLNLLGLAAAYVVVIYGYVKVHRLSLPVLIQDAKRLAGPKPKKKR